MLFIKEKKILGVDIGTANIKLAEVIQTEQGYQLLSFEVIPVPPGVIEGEKIVNTDFVSKAVDGVVKKVFGKKKKYAGVALCGSCVTVKKITVPRMNEEFIKEQIKWEAEQYIPYDIEETHLGFEILNANSDKENIGILLVAATQSSISERVDILSKIGLECKLVDVEGFALANCFEKNYAQSSQDAQVLLNVGDKVTNFVGINKGEIVFCRDLSLGGASYTSVLEGHLEISTAEAEEMKLGFSRNEPVPKEAGEVLQLFHKEIIEEIKSNLDIFCSDNSVLSVQKCYVTGGGARVPGFLEQLSSLVPCEKLNPLQKVMCDKNKFSPQYLDQISDLSPIALGLALRKAGE